MKTPIIETERIILREIHADDVNEIFDCWMQDEDVSRYMWWKASNNITDAKDFVEFELQQIDSDKWYRWIIELKETGQIIGTCLVFYNEDDVKPHWDISYNLGKAFWNNGYVIEAMKEVMTFAVNELGMKECETTYARANSSSAYVLHKLGFIDEAEIMYECSGGEIVNGICARILGIK